MPDGFFGMTMEAAGVRLPPAGQYAVGQVFLPQDEQQRDIAKRVMESVAAELGHDGLAGRRVPSDNRCRGARAVKVEPIVEQWFVSADGAKHRQLDAEGQVGGWGLGGRQGGRGWGAVWGAHCCVQGAPWGERAFTCTCVCVGRALLSNTGRAFGGLWRACCPGRLRGAGTGLSLLWEVWADDQSVAACSMPRER